MPPAAVITSACASLHMVRLLPRVGLHQCPSEKIRPKRAGLPSAHPVSRPHLCVESRESAGLFAGGLAVHCRDGLAAGGNRIRTIGPAKKVARKTVDYGSVAHRDRRRRGAPRSSTHLLRQWATHCRYQGRDDRRFYNYRPTRARPQRVKCLSNEFSIELNRHPARGRPFIRCSRGSREPDWVWPAISGQLSATRLCSLSSA